MSTYFRTEDSASGSGPDLSSLSTFVTGTAALHMKTLVEEPKAFLQDASHGFQNLVLSLWGTSTTPERSLRKEVSAPGFSSRTVQPATDTAQSPIPSTSNNPPSSGAQVPEAASQIARGGENGLLKAIRMYRRRAGAWSKFLFVGLLPLALIVVPGLVLGLVTGQPPWGISLSGTVATVCGFFAGPVYTVISAGETGDSRGEETGDEMV